jgi:hypothetical protein
MSADSTSTTTMATLITIMVTAKPLGRISRNEQSLSWLQELDQELITGMSYEGNSPLFYSNFFFRNAIYLSFFLINIFTSFGKA